MWRRPALLGVALAATVCPVKAVASQTTIPVRGVVQSFAFSGDALIVARKLDDGSIRVERRTPGAPVRVLFRLERGTGDTYVRVVASAQAIALSVYSDNVGDSDDGTPSATYAGPPTGPFRKVASCANGFVASALAVSGTRIAWSDGGCSEETTGVASPLTLVIGTADPAAPVRRIAVPGEALANDVVLAGERGVIGLVRPAFFALRGEALAFGPGGLSAPIAKQPRGTLAPVGVLSSGEPVLSFEDFDQEEGDTTCDVGLYALTAGGRRELALGDCATDLGLTASSGDAAVEGDRVFAIVEPAENGEFAPARLVSIGGDGTNRREHVRGIRRSPDALGTAPGRLAWLQERCSGGGEIVIEDQPATTGAYRIPSCSVKLLTRSARVRGRGIGLRLRCSIGCRGVLTAQRRRSTRFLRSYALKAGTHRLRVRLTRRERRAARLRLRVTVESGRSRTAIIRLR